MIAKVSRRVADGSFGRLAAYVTDLQKIGDLRDWRATADYILDKKGAGERVEAVRVTNCRYDEPGMALAEVAATQALNTKSGADKTYHLIVSFPPGEKPTPDQLHDIEDSLCAAIGLADHQRLTAVHADKGHFHFHVAINKIHPTTFRAVTPYFDQPRLQAACAALEQKHGLTATNHEMPDRSNGHAKGRAAAMEVHGRQQSLNQWVRDEAGPALLAAQETGRSWQDLHAAAARYGLLIKPRGAGLVIAVDGDKTARVKPSDIDPRLAFAALTGKWGAYQPPIGPSPDPEKRYPRAPIQTKAPQTRALFETYKAERQHALAARRAANEAATAASRAYRAELKAWAAARTTSIKQARYPAFLLRSAYEDLDRARTKALQDDKAILQKARSDAAAANPLPTWQDWLAAQAKAGNTQALEVMRATEKRQTELAAALLSAGDPERARHILYQHLKPGIDRDGAVTYAVEDGGRVTDRATDIKVDEPTTAATVLALTLAADRFGDRPLVVEGTDAFKAKVAQVAGLYGLDVTFKNPDLEALRRNTRPVLAARGQPQPDELTAFIERRNATRDRVTDITPHRLWTEADAGTVRYGGRRSLSPGTTVILLHSETETLVRTVTAAQANAASSLQVGDTVEIDRDGRMTRVRTDEHRPELDREQEQDQAPDLGR